MNVLRALQSMVITGALLAGVAGQAHATVLSGTVHLDAEPGNYVSYELPDPTTWRHGIDGTMSSNDTIGRAGDGVNVLFEHDGLGWMLQFVAPQADPLNALTGRPLEVGLYDGVNGDARFDPTRPGMLISSPLGQVWEWSGWFNVLDIAYDQNGDLSRFAVDFMQFDTPNQSGPALRGALRFNSAIPIAGVNIPEPGSVLLVLAGLGMLGFARRQRG